MKIIHLQWLAAEQGQERKGIREETEKIAAAHRAVARQLGTVERQADKLKEEIFQLKEAQKADQVQWTGPDNTDHEDLPEGEIYVPEFLYCQERAQQEAQGQSPESWEDYWDQRGYYSFRRTTDDIQREGYSHADLLWTFDGPENYQDTEEVKGYSDQACLYHFKRKVQQHHQIPRRIIRALDDHQITTGQVKIKKDPGINKWLEKLENGHNVPFQDEPISGVDLPTKKGKKAARDRKRDAQQIGDDN
ncbi:hypothetical protein NEMBOFW57_007168 [Staphylotrichum longicolle]|uniref:Uncharacterized protein n=1 Tax=Staphylotrichum longicolle TaxID=669026 RepID=A0AAD4HYT5_9PEZI|nr:hypothetical protein NEMBOFW57_007168 [Staphylotrichum longicolle]